MKKEEVVYKERFEKHLDELRWLYMELYDNGSMFAELCDNLYRFYQERRDDLKKLDVKREAEPDWYKKNDMLGMMLYIDNFAGTWHNGRFGKTDKGLQKRGDKHLYGFCHEPYI